MNLGENTEAHLLAAIVESSEDAIVSKTLEGVVTSWNNAAEQIFGYAAPEAIGKPITLIIPEERLSEEDHILSCVRRGERVAHFETVRRRKDGTLIDVSLTVSPIKDYDGRIIGASKIARDITAQKNVLARFNAFLESAPDAIVVVDREGQIVLVNHLTEVMFGFARHELVGQPVEQLVPQRYRHSHVKQRDSYFDHPKTRPMGAGRALAGRKKDGREFPVEISLSPLQTERGTFTISIIRDVSARHEADAKFRSLLESAPDGIVVVDSSGRMVIVNTQMERLFGYAREELLGKPIEVLVPDHLRDSHIRDRDGYVESPRTRPMGAGRALTGRKKDGSQIPVEVSLSPLKTQEGTLIMSIVRDITERRRFEEQITASLREKEVLLKEIHHRVKNNLQVTSSLLKLQSGYIHDPRALEMFTESQNRIRSMALVHEKLYQSSDLSRINFSEYVQSLAQLLFRSYSADAQRIRLMVEGEPLYLTVDVAVPCGLILNELISNCLKHAFPDKDAGEIRVRVHQGDKEDLLLAVRDNGRGLPAGLDLRRTESLGLQLVQMLTQQLSGVLEYETADRTEFRVRFPLPKATS